MRIVLENILSEEDVDSLLLGHIPPTIENWGKPYSYGTGGSGDFSKTPALERLANEVAKHAPITLESPSNWYIECRPAGHEPHYDGCRPGKGGTLEPNHMAWCQYSAVTLLTDPASFSGGELSFYDPDEVHKDDLRGNLVIYSSGIANDPQKHSAAPHEGGIRMMLLMFFAAA